MDPVNHVNRKVQALRRELEATEAKLSQLRIELQEAESHVDPEGMQRFVESQPANMASPLLPVDYKRYGRQLILPEVGLLGQSRLKDSSVLIVGVGGLGCPAAAYLAGAGLGRIGLVDDDAVEMSNLHRQILHTVEMVGLSKVESAIRHLQRLNPRVRYIPHRTRLTAQIAPVIFEDYDIILDCTDNPATRYLISDTAVLLQKPLVSASALRTEGQLVVLNHPPRAQGDSAGGPCYRCVFPKPPPVESVLSCGEGGILGPVVGVMGVLQALEAIRLIVSEPITNNAANAKPSLLLFSAYSNPQFRAVRLRPRRHKCASCSTEATVTKETLATGSLDYIQFCGVSSPVNILSDAERISALGYKTLTQEIPTRCHLLVDVREEVQFRLVHLDGSINIPISNFASGATSSPDHWAAIVHSKLKHADTTDVTASSPDAPIYVVCRFGNDSQLAVRKMKEAGLDNGGKRYIGDIRGGLRSWRDEVDVEWPDY